jgi:hypothetical protein
VTFWPIHADRNLQAELDDLVYSILRSNRRAVHLCTIARLVRRDYPSNGPFTWLTGTVELCHIERSLLRLAIKGYIYRIGTERHNRLDLRYDPLAVDDGFTYEMWPKWKPVPLLEALARAAS